MNLILMYNNRKNIIGKFNKTIHFTFTTQNLYVEPAVSFDTVILCNLSAD